MVEAWYRGLDVGLWQGHALRISHGRRTCPPPPGHPSGGESLSIRSAFRVLQPLDRDPVHALERQASRGVEKVGKLPRGGYEGGGDVQGSDEVLVEELGVADDLAVVEDGVAVSVRFGGETEAEALGDAGEDGTGEERVFLAVEDGGGDGAGALFERFAEAEDGPASFGLLREGLDVPGDGEVGFAGGDRLVPLGEMGQELRREGGGGRL